MTKRATKPAKRGSAKPASRAESDREVHDRLQRERDPRLLAKVRKLCLAYPESSEVEQFGAPWFKAGKRPFVVYGTSEKVDGVWRGRDGVSFAMTRMDQSALCEDPRFKPTPYMHQHGWVTLTFATGIDWSEVADLVDSAYRNVANKRMLKALDGATAAPRRPA
jgi:predicted DNA-binding protein (MmcQ/YjbR family)